MKSTETGYINKNNQKNNGRRGRSTNHYNQWFYEMECLECGHKYDANGSDIWLRKCPKCQVVKDAGASGSCIDPDKNNKSSSIEQMNAENIIFSMIEKELATYLERNPKIFLADNVFTYIQPDFYSEEKNIVGEIFAHIGKPKKAQDNKIANDILKMLLLEKVKGQSFRKILVVCDKEEQQTLTGLSALAESIRQFGIEVMYVEITEDLKKELLLAQERQKMVNA